MFNNPETLWIEILVIIIAIAFLGFVIGRYIYKKVNHLPTGECECCHKSSKKLVNEYHKKYQKSE